MFKIGASSKKKKAGESAAPKAKRPSRGGAAKPEKAPAKSPAKAFGRPEAKATKASASAKIKGLRKPAPRPPAALGIGAVENDLPIAEVRSIGIVAAEAARDKKAFDIVVLDVREISGLCDEMVVVSARSTTHLSAVCDAIEENLSKIGEKTIHSDGRHAAEPDWVLLDYGDLMVHIFREETRSATRLEDFYGAAKVLARFKND
jgi:ribosome-associated protein